MDAPPFRDGAVVFQDDRILAVGPARDMAAAHPAAEVRDLGGITVLPGLVNAHTHLELSGGSCAEAPASFTDWILSIPQRIGRDRAPPEELFPAAVRMGIGQCLRFGVTTVGDVSQQMHLTRPVLRDGPLRCVSYGEVLGLGKMRDRFEELLPRAIDLSLASDRLRIGLTPHAPYTVDHRGFEQCLRIARDRGLPFATHLAETPDEEPFLRHHAGPFRELWESIGRWEPGLPTFPGGPIPFANELGLLDHPTLLAHVNYCDDDGLDLLARGKASVVYCPRTHRYFGHPPHRWREMLARGINVAVGTDSCASSPDLNLIDDLRLLHEIAPELPAQTLWELVTIRAARAVQHPHIGRLAPGQHADFAIFPTTDEDPLRSILEQNLLPAQVWIGGQPIASSST